jgi:hypothetical protein
MTIRCLAHNCLDCFYEAYLTARDPAYKARRLGWHYVRVRRMWICPNCWHALTHPMEARLVPEERLHDQL